MITKYSKAEENSEIIVDNTAVNTPMSTNNQSTENVKVENSIPVQEIPTENVPPNLPENNIKEVMKSPEEEQIKSKSNKVVKNKFRLKNTDLYFFIFILLAGLNILCSVFLYFQKNNFDKISREKNLTLFLEKNNSISDYNNSIKKLDALLPEQPAVINLINILNEAELGMDNFSFSFTQDEPLIKAQKYLPLIISLSGRKETVQEFLNKLLKSQYLFDIINLDLGYKKSPNLTPDTSKMEAVLKLNLLISDNFK